MTANVVVVEYDTTPALPSERRWITRLTPPPYEGEGFQVGHALSRHQHIAARLADEIGSSDLAWSTIPELLETLEHGAWTGKAEDVEILRGLSSRAAYDLVRRTLARLVDAQLVELTPATQEPREGSRVYRLAL